MKLVHSVYYEEDVAPTKETFIQVEDLNSHFEYPLKVENGFWLSPALEGDTSPWIEYAKTLGKDYDSKKKHFYMLNPDAKIYHFHSVAAITRFPKKMNGLTNENNRYRIDYVRDLMDKLALVVSTEKVFFSDDISIKKKIKNSKM